MKRLHLIIIVAMTVCVISCKDKCATSAVNDNIQDSIIEASVENPFGFLERLGIDYVSLIAGGDTLPIPSDNDCLLTTKEQEALLKGVINADFDISNDSLVYLVAIRQIADDVILCQYKHTTSYYDEVYIATYNIGGVLMDALYVGNRWDESCLGRYLPDSKTLSSISHSQINFIGDNEFTLTWERKESEYDQNSRQLTITYCKAISLTYNIASDGKIIMTLPEAEVNEYGVYRLYDNPDSKKEFDLMDDIYTLNLYPYSDEKALERWNSMGKIVDGAPAESFGYYLFKYVFMPRPQKVLKWIYENRDDESINLPMFIKFEYNNDPHSCEIVDAAIAKLDDVAMRTYYNELTTAWLKDKQY